MRDEWELDELIACWTLDEGDWRLLSNKTGAPRLGFALLLKFFDLEGRFPADRSELPAAAVDYVAGMVKIPPEELARYAWRGRTMQYHRAQIRAERGFREATGEDERRMAAWLAGELCPIELSVDRLRDDLLARFLREGVEPPAPSRVERILGAGRSLFERGFTERIVERLPASAIAGLERLLDAEQDGVLAELKSDPGKPGLNTILDEIAKLERIAQLELPADLFADCSEKLIAAWRARASAAYPSDLRAMPQPIGLTLLAVLCWARIAEITDGLVDLLIRWCTRSAPAPRTRLRASSSETSRRCAASRGCCSRSPKPPSSIRTRRSARRCSQSSRRSRSSSWWRRRARTNECSKRGCAK